METAARVVAVAPGSPAERAGLAPGDEVLALNGEEPRDVVRFQLLADEPALDLDVRRGGLERTMRVDTRAGEPLGLELKSAVFDRVRTCDNHCPFCFIHQLPPGMRSSLALKDDDYRLSFLYGNFTTLTRFTEADLERVVEERLSPLYVSIHATDPDVRSTLLRNRRGATSLRWLRAILDHGIQVHGQVVVCPDINDGAVLDDTLLGILDRFPEIATVGVVPVGVSDHNSEPDIRPHTPEEARVTLATVQRWQERFLAALGRRVAFAADELYLLAGEPFPEAEEYEGFPQHENGIGMARTLELDVRTRLRGDSVDGRGPREGFFAWVEGREAHASCEPEGYRAPRTNGVAVTLRAPRRAPVALVTGDYGARVLAPLLPALSERAGVEVRTLAVANRYFGGNIAVAGLLTTSDVAAALAGEPAEHRYLLPDVVLSKGRFLDDGAPADLPRPVEVLRTDGASLVDALS